MNATTPHPKRRSRPVYLTRRARRLVSWSNWLLGLCVPPAGLGFAAFVGAGGHLVALHGWLLGLVLMLAGLALLALVLAGQVEAAARRRLLAGGVR